MRRYLLVAFFCCGIAVAAALAQTATTKKSGTTAAKPAAKTSSKAQQPAAPAGPPTAVFETSMGQISCVLFPKEAPITVANFMGLATGTRDWTHIQTGKLMRGVPLYDNTVFHRVIPNFMIQGGDPLGTGAGNPGYRFEDEFVAELRFDRPGRLAMANAGPGTNGSQFFITEVPTPHLDGRHTIFGQCDDSSVEIVKAIARVATDPRNNRPEQEVKLVKITILNGPKRVAPKSTTPVKRPAKSKTPTTQK